MQQTVAQSVRRYAQSATGAAQLPFSVMPVRTMALAGARGAAGGDAETLIVLCDFDAARVARAGEAGSVRFGDMVASTSTCPRAGSPTLAPLLAPDAGMWQATLSELRALLDAEAAAAGGARAVPAGFVIHESHSGSSLVSAMLAADADNVVVADATVLDGALASGELSVRDAVTLVEAMCRPARAGKRVFIKFGAAVTLHATALLAALPSVPWVFLFRDPVEVVGLQLRHHARGSGGDGGGGGEGAAADDDDGRGAAGGAQPTCVESALAVNGPPAGVVDALRGAGVEAAGGVVDIQSVHPDLYCAAHVAALGRTALDMARSGGQRGAFVPYDDLPAAVVAVILPHFGVKVSHRGATAQAMRQAAQAHAAVARGQRVPQLSRVAAGAVSAMASPVFQELTAAAAASSRRTRRIRLISGASATSSGGSGGAGDDDWAGASGWLGAPVFVVCALALALLLAVLARRRSCARTATAVLRHAGHGLPADSGHGHVHAV